jgi:hypothetical protein
MSDIGTGSGNLAGELINELQQTNPPGAINFEDAAPYPSPDAQQVPSQGPGQGQGQGQDQGQGQGPVQINPQLRQQFVNVLKQDPQIQQKFANPEIFQQALQNPTVMMNTISYFQQQANSQHPSSSPPPPPPSAPAEEEEPEEETDDKAQQYEIDDLEPMTVKSSWIDKIFRSAREPIVMTILFLLLTLPAIRAMIIQWIPKLQDAPTLQMMAFAGIFFIVAWLLKLGAQYLS